MCMHSVIIKGWRATCEVSFWLPLNVALRRAFGVGLDFAFLGRAWTVYVPESFLHLQRQMARQYHAW